MLKVLIVDDELVIRAGIKSIIEWDILGLKLIGEAGNGKEALKIIESELPDIILLDIIMPELNGIELLKILKKRNIQASVIILSCYNEFEYVREAMKLGAVDYLQKLSLETDELTELLKDVSKDIITNKKNGKNDRVEDDSILDYLKYLISKSDEGYDICHVSKNKITEFKNIIDNHSSVICLVEFEDERNVNKQIILNAITEVLKHRNLYYISEIIYGTITIIISKINSESILEQTLQGVKNILNLCLDTDFSIGISNIFESIDEMQSAYSQALHSTKYRFYLPSGNLIYYKDTKPFSLNNTIFDSEFSNELFKAIEIYNSEIIFNLINKLFDNVLTTGDIEPEIIKNGIIEVINLFSKILKLNNYHLADFGKSSSYAEIMMIKNVYDLKEWIIMFVEDYINFMNKENKENVREEVVIVKKYIQENYSNELNLSNIASHVNFSENYLSTLFKKETGENIFDYINKVRIDKAKQLLMTKKYKVFEVSYMVGYNSISYFSKVFKKLTKTSPSMWGQA